MPRKTHGESCESLVPARLGIPQDGTRWPPREKAIERGRGQEKRDRSKTFLRRCRRPKHRSLKIRVKVDTIGARLSFPVVGIGSSAGGLDAFTKFFKAMPADGGVAFVLVPHLDPKHDSLMVELLARHTAMPVLEAREGETIQVNHVYIIPPNKFLAIKDGRLRLTILPDPRGRQTALDTFFRSLAQEQEERAIGIVLSGTGSHGTLGLKEIKMAGGMAMVQEPESADFDQMPRSAIATGLVDYVLPPERMPEAILAYVRHPYVTSGSVACPDTESYPEILNSHPAPVENPHPIRLSLSIARTCCCDASSAAWDCGRSSKWVPISTCSAKTRTRAVRSTRTC